MRKSLTLMISVVFLFSLVLAGCSGGEESKKIKLAYVAWDSEIASTNVVKTVLEEKLGYEVEMLQVDAGPMWQGVSDGSADAMVAAWLPGTHKAYYEKYEENFEDLGANLEGAAIGLVVPTYLEISSVEELADPDVAKTFGGEIIGIEPGAGLMAATENAIADYGLDMTLVNSSSAAMAQELQKAYEEQRPIVVTGWTPHWKFAKMELKYLEDPQGVYGEAEHINTIVRQGLADDMADAYKFLDQFNWSPDDMAEVMVAIQEGTSPEEAAKTWVDANADKVNAWLEGVE